MLRKRISAFLCTTALILCVASPPAYAAERSSACYYPVEVESYTAGDFDQPRIRKVYQLSRSDDPAGIPTNDFVEYGRTFHLMEMTRKDEIGVDTQPLTKTITTDSSTGDLGEVLKQLAPEIATETEDGHTGTLKLDYNSVMVEVKGYKTSTKNLSASRVYSDLSDADLSLVPKTVQEGGRTLNLADVKWSSSTDMEGEDMVMRYTAVASYTGSVSNRYATGYTVKEDINVNRSKTAALVPPGFGSPTSYLPGSGEYLTPNLAPGAMNGGLVNSVSGMGYTSLPSVDGGAGGSFIPSTSISGGSEVTITTASASVWQDSGNAGYTRYTDVTSDLYYSDGSLGKLQIPSIGVNARIVQGTDKAALAKGIGHFEDTSIWGGNVCLAAHNRGYNAQFGKIHTLNEGDTIVLTTQLGTRTYYVTNVKKVSETDNSDTAATAGNQITLYTCVQNESEYRWCVTGVELV